MPKPLPSHVQQPEGYHRLPIRMAPMMNNYLEHLSFKTGLDKAQLVRLMIFLSVDNKDFNEIVSGYTRADRRGLLWVHDWRDQDHLWKRC